MNCSRRRSGIPLDGRLPSDFYSKPSAFLVMRRFLDLLTRKAAFVLLSYSSGGNVPEGEWSRLLRPYRHSRVTVNHPAFSALREEGAPSTVREHIFVVARYEGRGESEGPQIVESPRSVTERQPVWWGARQTARCFSGRMCHRSAGGRSGTPGDQPSSESEMRLPLESRRA